MRHIYRIAWITAALVLGCLGTAGLFVHYAVNLATFRETTFPVTTNPLATAALAAIFIAAMLALSSHVSRAIRGNRRRLALFVVACAAFVIALGVAWIIIYPYASMADQLRIYHAARCLYSGEPLPQDLAEYINLYPHQKSLSLVIAGLFTIVGRASSKACYCVFAVSAGFWTVGLCVLAHDLFQNEQITIACALLSALCIPLPLYTTYLYGTIIAPTLVTWSFIGTERFMRQQGLRWLLLPVLLLWFANRCYGGTIVGTIAVVLALVLYAITKRNTAKTVVASIASCILILLFFFVGGKCLDALFNRLTNTPPSSGAPATAWIAMGITSTGDLGEGAWNNLNAELYVYNNRDSSVANEEAMRIIRDAVSDYVAGRRPLSFFAYKTARQWLDPTFGSITMTIHTTQDPGQPFSSFLYGPVFALIQEHQTAFMIAVYVCAATACVCIAWSEKREYAFVLILYFIGGFLFQLIWEQKSRYCFPYLLGLIPIAALGMCRLKSLFQTMASKLAARYGDRLPTLHTAAPR